MTTGNLYTQIFDPSLGRFSELQSDINPIQVVASTGSLIGKLFLPYTGLNIDIFNTRRIVMYPINIGGLNLSSGNAINVGVSNFSLDTAPVEVFVPLKPGLVNIGENNFISGVSSVNIGNANFKSNSWYSYTLGESNQEQDASQIYTLGRGNQLSGVIWTKILGLGNALQKTSSLPPTGVDVYKIVLAGDENSVKSGVGYISILGNDNDVNLKSYKIAVVGDANSIQYTSGEGSLIFGYENLLFSGIDNVILGNRNDISKSNDQYIFGSDNLSTNSNDNVIFGNANSLFSGALQTSNYGNLNSSSSINSKIYGDANFTDNSSNSSIYGSNNLISGYENGLIVGSNNQTPESGGASNVLVGNYNTVLLNNQTNIFGNNNIASGNGNSYIFGDSNYAGRSISSYILGEDNIVSGFQNYVIGNNNVVRSGDYNSILIGISHEFTGDYKVASINLAAVDSQLNISPSDINLISSNRPKWNGQDISIETTESTGLRYTNVHDSYVIYDQSYDSLSDQIELQSFGYSGREDRYLCGFSWISGYRVFPPGMNTAGVGGRIDVTNIYNFTGFFRKRLIAEYNGKQPFGNSPFWYESYDKKYEAVFAFNGPAYPFLGNWVISPANNTGIIFYHPTETGYSFPTSNWATATVENGEISGVSPVPSFAYSSSFTGFFANKILNALDSYPSNFYFNNQGTVAYSSPDSDIAVIYGTTTTSSIPSAWLIVDKYSSGLYYINNNVSPVVTPQTGWIATGLVGYSGINPRIIDSGIKISLGTRSGLMSSSHPNFGRIYIPFYY